MDAQLSISAVNLFAFFDREQAGLHDLAALPLWLRGLLGFILGACFGSFANAMAMRLVDEKISIGQPSRCRQCDRRLSAIDLMPIFGWIRFGGLCRCRLMRLHWRYIFAEVTLAVLVAAYAILLPETIAAGFAIAAIFMMISAMTDFETLTLHPPLLVLFAATGIVLSIAGDAGLINWHLSSADSLIGLGTGAAAPFLINAAYRALRGQNGFGEGDIWLLGAIGVWAGWVLVLMIFLGAAFVGAIIGGLMIIGKGGNGQSKLPFGSLLAGIFMLCPLLLNGLAL